MLLAVALSGGVDSSVAALMLKERGTRLVGATHLVWPGSRTCSEEALGRARELCRRLGIPYVLIDQQEQFSRQVVEDFVAVYQAGRTPNPCVRCNRWVRFGSFLPALQARLEADGLLAAGEELGLATGHYARVLRTVEGLLPAKGLDPAKDQSYMLHQVQPEVLPRLVLPLGERLKRDVVRQAAEAGLPAARAEESQDACFVDGGYAAFLRTHGAPEELFQRGDIVDARGRLLGRHRGVIRYTVGQRSGLGLGNGPWYVARIEPEANRLVVARREEAERSGFEVDEVNWFVEPPRARLECAVKVRYRSREVPAGVEPEEVPGRFRVALSRPEIVTPGQSAVFYRGEWVLGGGVILP